MSSSGRLITCSVQKLYAQDPFNQLDIRWVSGGPHPKDPGKSKGNVGHRCVRLCNIGCCRPRPTTGDARYLIPHYSHHDNVPSIKRSSAVTITKFPNPTPWVAPPTLRAVTLWYLRHPSHRQQTSAITFDQVASRSDHFLIMIGPDRETNTSFSLGCSSQVGW